MAFPAYRLGAREAHDAGVEILHLLQVAAEKPDRAVAHDLERPRQQDAVDVVLRRHRLRVAEARIEIDALRRALLHFLVLGHLRQGRPLAESALVHRLRLGEPRPADLLHAVVDLVAVALRIVGITMPVGARHIAAGAADAHALRAEPVDRARDLRQARNLPGHLVHGDVRRRVAAAAGGVVDDAVAQHEGMMIGAVAQEIHMGVAELPQLVALRVVLGDVERVGDAEAQALAVEIEAGRGIGHVQPEMTQAPDLERLRQHHAADVEANALFLCHDRYSS